MTRVTSDATCRVKLLHVRPAAFDLTSVPALGALFDRVLALRPAHVVADLSGCRHLDAAGIGLLLDVHRRLLRADAMLTVADPNPRIRRILEVTRVTQVLPVVVHDGPGAPSLGQSTRVA